MRTLIELFIHELRDLYDAEHQVVDALPKMAEAAESDDLRAAFEEHLGQSRTHIERLERVFKHLDRKPTRKTCDGMKGLMKEGESVLEEDMDASVRDAALIAAAQRVEHYEMAGYGTLRTFAHVLGQAEIAHILQETLDEEEMTDKRLTQLAHAVNATAHGQ